MKVLKLISALLIVFAFSKCGDPDVNITSVQYEPKIAVEAYLFCGETVKDIRITKNFKLSTTINPNNLFLTPQRNKATITLNGTDLFFDPVNSTYYNNQITIDYNTAYHIEINAEIGGKQLTASATTVTPQKGFSVINRELGTVRYRQTKTLIDFKTSAGTDLYIFSIVSDSADINKFIYDNPYFPNMNAADVRDNYNGFRYQLNSVENIDSYSANTYSYELKGYDTWFYGPYTVTVYAGDKNMRYYLATAMNVQEMDGNFHEPMPIFAGDGIGVFASAIKETVKFKITR